MPDPRDETRLVAMTRAQADHVRWLAETARRLSTDPRTKKPEKFKADSDAAFALADAFESGITAEEYREIRFQMLESQRGFGHAPTWHTVMDKLAAFEKDPHAEEEAGS